MNLAETTYWISQLFPGEPTIEQRVTVLPGRGRHGQDHESDPVQVAEFSLYDESSPNRAETAAATMDLGRVECGLTGEDGTDVRVELFSVGFSDFPIADVVAAGAAIIMDEPHPNSPIPGRVLEGAVAYGMFGPAGVPGDARADHAALEDSTGAGENAGQDASASDLAQVTVRHLLCVVPYVWPDGVPNVSEVAGQVNVFDEDTESSNGRLTTITQLVPITDAEYEYYQANGPQGLMMKLADANADLRDYLRSSVV